MSYQPDPEELEAGGGLSVATPDANLEDADWAKSTWDLPPYKSPEFMRSFPDLDAFRRLPVYNAAVKKGLIIDDEWAADYIKDV